LDLAKHVIGIASKL
nr:RecName: Full=Fallaxidin-3.1.1 [Litoria fallax]